MHIYVLDNFSSYQFGQRSDELFTVRDKQLLVFCLPIFRSKQSSKLSNDELIVGFARNDHRSCFAYAAIMRPSAVRLPKGLPKSFQLHLSQHFKDLEALESSITTESRLHGAEKSMNTFCGPIYFCCLAFAETEFSLL